MYVMEQDNEYLGRGLVPWECERVPWERIFFLLLQGPATITQI
jgi:hypothetical protein